MRHRVQTDSQVKIAWAWRRYWKRKLKKIQAEKERKAKKAAAAAAAAKKGGKSKKGKKGKNAGSKADLTPVPKHDLEDLTSATLTIPPTEVLEDSNELSSQKSDKV